MPLNRRVLLAGVVSGLSRSASSAVPAASLTPEMFGADPTGRSDSSEAFKKMLETSVQTRQPCICSAPGRYIVASPVVVDLAGSPVCFTGRGIGKTVIRLVNHTPGLVFAGRQTAPSSVRLSGFSIGRDDAESYTGRIGPRALEVNWSNGVTVEEVEEWGGIGFGIFLDHCSNYLVRQCLVRDHKGGAVPLSGTDGIHVYRSSGPGEVHDNVVENVGDDAISFGSFDPRYPTLNLRVFHNSVQDVAGSIKIYGEVHEFEVTDNKVTRSRSAGVNVWDDGGSDRSFSISGGVIARNQIVGQLGAGISGGISLWMPGGSGSGSITNVKIIKNNINDCSSGIVVASQVSRKSIENVFVTENEIRDARGFGILIQGYGGQILVADNQIHGTAQDGIKVSQPATGATVASVNLAGNVIDGYSQKRPATFAAIRVERTTTDQVVTLRNNQVRGAPSLGGASSIIAPPQTLLDGNMVSY